MSVTLNASTSSGLVQTADTSGTIELQSNGTTKLTVSSSGVNIGQMNGGAITAATAVTASGASVDFTNIPSWVKRITVTMTGISFAAAGVGRIRIGTSGGLVTTGYAGGIVGVATTPIVSLDSLGASPEGLAGIGASAAGTVITGQFVIVNVTGNTWQCTGSSVRNTDTAALNISNGWIALSGTLDRLSLVATTSTFDAGTINILYEG
jgi:hypothetical protein